MDLLEIIKNRRSIRRFEDRFIPEEIIEKLKEALIWAPSAGNLQARKFYFVFDKEIKKKLVRAALFQNFINQAPLVVVACADLNRIKWYGQRGKNIYAICDVALSIQNMMLLARAEGLGTCWVGAFQEKKVSKILDLTENLKPIAIVPVGFPAKTPSAPARVSKSQAVKILE